MIDQSQSQSLAGKQSTVPVDYDWAALEVREPAKEQPGPRVADDDE